ncbi:MAG: hypothetical protein PWP41_383 [Moorella sp. (in: firmicutes)]|uniref:Uncharacterized protein n=1 Tax=Neomoorella thermoacetica TaxID=1525 RepID=A0A1J5P0W3_NEOTH|nr:hypothetical protein [Moorella sp. (in: firmicutes)]OIQ61543.1 hypothetical protein MOTE_01130 [Moorella thermoacetica]
MRRSRSLEGRYRAAGGKMAARGTQDHKKARKISRKIPVEDKICSIQEKRGRFAKWWLMTPTPNNFTS